MSFQKMYGLYGQNHHIVEISGDVTDAGWRTTTKEDSEQNLFRWTIPLVGLGQYDIGGESEVKTNRRVNPQGLQVSLNYPTTSIKAVPFSSCQTCARQGRASKPSPRPNSPASVKTAKRLSKVQPCCCCCWWCTTWRAAEKQKRLRPPIIGWSIAG